MDPAVLSAAIAGGAGLFGTGAGLLVGRRQRRAQLADLETAIAERLLKRLDEELKDALADVDRLRTEVAHLRRRLEERDALVEELRGERDHARAEVATLRTQLAAKEAALAGAMAEVDHLKALVAHGQAAAAGATVTPPA
jgi:chromosome segregation ATPase